MRDDTQLTQEECYQIEALLKMEHHQSEIAVVLKRHKSTISRAVRRSPAEAAAGKLLFMVGAETAQLERARPLLDAMGDTVLHCGAVGSGIRMKLVLNPLSQATCQLSAEVVALGLKLGLDAASFSPVM